MVRVLAKFKSRDAVNQVHSYLKQSPPFGSVPCYLKLPPPLSYIMTIPWGQYSAQEAEWNKLIATKDESSCQLMRLPVSNKPIVRFKLSGSDTKAVGNFKVRVESLARGEVIPGWNFRLNLSWELEELIARVQSETNAFMQVDHRQHQIKVYGPPNAKIQARNLIEEELKRMSELEFFHNVPRHAMPTFLKRGLADLREQLGEKQPVHFDHASRRIRTSGGDDIRTTVIRIVDQCAKARTVMGSLGDSACPICFDEITAPVRLGCEHVYCSTCLQHFVSSAADSTTFPLKCMGNDAQCNALISLPIVESFLPAQQVTRLLDAAFRAHVAQRPQELKFCRTADCEQIYRAAATSQNARVAQHPAVQCPACLNSVCPQCHEDGHPNMTCEEHRVHANPEEQERLLDQWAASQGGRVRRCPQCRVFMEKIDGCNHMTCNCGAHVCWRCLGVFSSETIYDHMRDAHGNIGGAWDDDDDDGFIPQAPPAPALPQAEPPIIRQWWDDPFIPAAYEYDYGERGEAQRRREEERERQGEALRAIQQEEMRRREEARREARRQEEVRRREELERNARIRRMQERAEADARRRAAEEARRREATRRQLENSEWIRRWNETTDAEARRRRREAEEEARGQRDEAWCVVM
ncbi:hypothetical protein DL93DRAFT_2123282 [Clavulina sp. PMI_390]|nr:hypothetical protein DL93DRAFT_2123282 [Clavulina sp. PMI_390]